MTNSKNLVPFTAHVYWGSDRNDWRHWTFHASSLEEAKKKAARHCFDTMWTVRKVTEYTRKGEYCDCMTGWNDDI